MRCCAEGSGGAGGRPFAESERLTPGVGVLNKAPGFKGPEGSHTAAHINADRAVCGGKPHSPFACQAKLKKSSPMQPNDAFRRTTSKPCINIHAHAKGSEGFGVPQLERKPQITAVLRVHTHRFLPYSRADESKKLLSQDLH